MGSLVGHVATGFFLFSIGFWHLFNHTKLFALHRRHYISLPWFPSPLLRRLELYLFITFTSISIAMELVIGPDRHTPFDPDGTISSNHIHNFEHASISSIFFVYAAFALALDMLPRRHTAGGENILQLVFAMAFGQQLLLFHLHSTDHMGIEGHYHWLLQIVIAVSLATTLIGISSPASFVVSFTRSLSILFQGVWLTVTGFMLWTPALIAKGCFLNMEEGHTVVRCDGEEALHRAKGIVTVEFSWLLIGLAVFAAVFYIVMIVVYAGDGVEYSAVIQEEDVEAQRFIKVNGETMRSKHINIVNGKTGI